MSRPSSASILSAISAELVNGLGALVQETAYKAYGGSLGTPAANTAFGWQGLSGAYTDGSFPGIVLAGSRPYLPDVGRYASPSAAGSGGTTPYTYAGGNPASYSAPGEGDADDDGCKYGSWGALYGDYGPKGAQQLTAMPAYQDGSEDRRKLSAMATAIPGVSEAYMGYMALTGKDSIAGTCLSPGERLFTAAVWRCRSSVPRSPVSSERCVALMAAASWQALQCKWRRLRRHLRNWRRMRPLEEGKEGQEF